MPDYFDLEVSLHEIRPRIWRRFLLHDEATFLNLHRAIQVAGDWGDYHLFAFYRRPNWDARGVIAGIPDDEYEDPAPDAKGVKLSGWFTPDGPKECFYLYDFGDSWWHRVKLCGTVTLPERFTRRLLGGARAFPHEDSGGLPGYEECVEVATTGVDVEGRLEWLGGWMPEEFNLGLTRKEFDRKGRQRAAGEAAPARKTARSRMKKRPG